MKEKEEIQGMKPVKIKRGATVRVDGNEYQNNQLYTLPLNMLILADISKGRESVDLYTKKGEKICTAEKVKPDLFMTKPQYSEESEKAFENETRQVIAKIYKKINNQVAENIEKWGLQDLETLGLAAAEECGELAMAILKAKHENGKQENIDMEAIHLAAVCIQVILFRNKEKMKAAFLQGEFPFAADGGNQG